jgi:hypothetical protein
LPNTAPPAGSGEGGCPPLQPQSAADFNILNPAPATVSVPYSVAPYPTGYVWFLGERRKISAFV